MRTLNPTLLIVVGGVLVFLGFLLPFLIVIGLLFMLCVMFLPKGLAGLVRPRIEVLLNRRTQTPPASAEPAGLSPIAVKSGSVS